MIKIDDHTQVDLDALAQQHYQNLIGPLLADGINYHATSSLIQRIRNRKIIDAAIPDANRVAFWDFFLDNNFTNLARVITSRPDVLKTIITEINNLCGVGFLSNQIDYNQASLTAFGTIVKDVFNYELYRKKPECRENCSKFNLTYCPYCNEQVIQVITETKGLTGAVKRLALLQLDHFYPQSRHPYLGVSFFNLIPGCSPCNAQLKLEKEFDIDTHFNPFDKRFDEHFKFELSSIVLNSENDVEIIFSNRLSYPPNAVVDFRIITRYNNAHKKIIFKMYKNFKNRGSKIRQSLIHQFAGLFPSYDATTRLMLENYNIPINRNEINSIHLGKLKRDIASQFGLPIN